MPIQTVLMLIQIQSQIFAGSSAYQNATVTGMSTSTAEGLSDGNSFGNYVFHNREATVTAVSRALKAEYSLELAQDLKAILVLMQNQN